MIVVRAATQGEPVACQGCGTETSRVHGYRERTPTDVPVDGRRGVVREANVRQGRIQAPPPPPLARLTERHHRKCDRAIGEIDPAPRMGILCAPCRRIPAKDTGAESAIRYEAIESAW